MMETKPTGALDDKDSPMVEQLCRDLLIAAGADPDELVQAGVPQTHGTPQGAYFVVRPGAAVPLWRTFIGTARTFLKAAERVIEARKAVEQDAKPIAALAEFGIPIVPGDPPTNDLSGEVAA